MRNKKRNIELKDYNHTHNQSNRRKEITKGILSEFEHDFQLNNFEKTKEINNSRFQNKV
jgi:hypothetical protein